MMVATFGVFYWYRKELGVKPEDTILILVLSAIWPVTWFATLAFIGTDFMQRGFAKLASKLRKLFDEDSLDD
jgi:hypothetical protein